MKMQTPKMEFIAFVAQDVITTSGWGGMNMYAKRSVLLDYNAQYGVEGSVTRGSFDFDTAYFGSEGFGYLIDGPRENNLYPVEEPFGFYPEETWTANTWTGEKGTTYKHAKTLQDVLSWLAENNIQ